MEDEQSWSIFSVIGFILSFFGLLSLIGIILSAIGISETENGKKLGRGFAIAGLIIGIIVFSFSIITILGVLIVLPASGYLNPATIDESIIGGQTKVVVSGIGFNREFDYNKSIIIEISGMNNEITLLNGTSSTMVTMNGINNELILCGDESPMIKKNGINNEVFFIDC